jgi:hypothetical protein
MNVLSLSPSPHTRVQAVPFKPKKSLHGEFQGNRKAQLSGVELDKSGGQNVKKKKKKKGFRKDIS